MALQRSARINADHEKERELVAERPDRLLVLIPRLEGRAGGKRHLAE